MLTVVLGVAVIGVAMLAVAVLTGNTIVAMVVIALAALGLVLLVRDWLSERRFVDAAGEGQHQAPETSDSQESLHDEHADPDEFEPDVLYEEPDEPPDDPGEETHEGEYHGAGRDSDAN